MVTTYERVTQHSIRLGHWQLGIDLVHHTGGGWTVDVWLHRGPRGRR